MFTTITKLTGTAAVVGAILVPSALASQSPALHDAWYQDVRQARTSVQVSPFLHDSWYLTQRSTRISAKNPYGNLGPSPQTVKRINNAK